MKKIKILHIVHSLNMGGLENGVVNLSSLIDHDRFDIGICCIKEEGFLRSRLRNDVYVVSLDAEEGFDYFRFLKLAKIFKLYRPDIVHAHGWGSDLVSSFVAAKLARIPYYINGEHGVIYTETWKKRFFQKCLFSKFDKILTVSYELKDRLIEAFNVSPDKIVPIINGVDLDHFQLNKDFRIEKRKALGIEDNAFVVGTVGRLVPVKDYLTLIHAFEKVNHEYPESYLLFVGDGSEQQNLQEKVDLLNLTNRVIFVGKQRNVQEWYSVFDVFALTSICEGLSNTILEAMSVLLPVVATDVGDNSRLVNSGETGFIVEVGEVNQLTEKIFKLKNDAGLLKKMGSKARDRVVQQFALGKMISDYEKFYLELINEGKI